MAQTLFRPLTRRMEDKVRQANRIWKVFAPGEEGERKIGVIQLVSSSFLFLACIYLSTLRFGLLLPFPLALLSASLYLHKQSLPITLGVIMGSLYVHSTKEAGACLLFLSLYFLFSKIACKKSVFCLASGFLDFLCCLIWKQTSVLSGLFCFGVVSLLTFLFIGALSGLAERPFSDFSLACFSILTALFLKPFFGFAKELGLFLSFGLILVMHCLERQRAVMPFALCLSGSWILFAPKGIPVACALCLFSLLLCLFSVPLLSLPLAFFSALLAYLITGGESLQLFASTLLFALPFGILFSLKEKNEPFAYPTYLAHQVQERLCRMSASFQKWAQSHPQQRQIAAAHALKQITEEFSKPYIFEKEKSILLMKRLLQKDVSALDCHVYRQDHRYAADVRMLACKGSTACREVAEEEVCKLLQRSMVMDGACSAQSGQCMAHFVQAEKLELLIGVTGSHKKNSLLSGDCHAYGPLERGEYYLAVCDGMGSGAQAILWAQEALEVTQELLQAGFVSSDVLPCVNEAFIYKRKEKGEEGHVSMDLFAMDRRSGIGYLYKAGSAVSALVHQGKCRILRSSQPPVGALEKSVYPAQKIMIAPEDTLVLLTDGVCAMQEEGEAWLCSLLEHMDLRSPQSVSRVLMQASLQRNKGRDDATALVVRFVEAALL